MEVSESEGYISSPLFHHRLIDVSCGGVGVEGTGDEVEEVESSFHVPGKFGKEGKKERKWG